MISRTEQQIVGRTVRNSGHCPGPASEALRQDPHGRLVREAGAITRHPRSRGELSSERATFDELDSALTTLSPWQRAVTCLNHADRGITTSIVRVLTVSGS